MTETRPYKTCIEQIHQIVEGRQELQSEKMNMKIENMMLRIDVKIQQAITEGIDKYFGSQTKGAKMVIDTIKFIVFITSLAITALYIKHGG